MSQDYLGSADFVKEDAAAGHRSNVAEEGLVRSPYLQVRGHDGVVQVAHEDAVRRLLLPVLSLEMAIIGPP